MRPRRRAATALLALALVGGAAGAAAGASSSRSSAPAGAPVSPTAPARPTAVQPPVQEPAGDREGFAPSVALDVDQASGEASDQAPGSDAAASDPVEVAVPRIGVDTALVRLGIAADGSLEVPGRGDFDRAGWLTTSAVPGEAGASVIAGHVDSTSGPAVFYRLHELVPGDEVQVQRADGEVVVFTVDEVRRVGKDAFPTAEVYGPQPGPVLRLVTCGGEFDRSSGHYTDNVIAFASAA